MRAITQRARAYGMSKPAVPVPLDPFEIVSNGVWTWFTDPRAVYRNGATYIGWVSSAGTCGISKYVHATEVTTSFSLSVGLEVDDHNNVAIHFATDGRVVAFYSKHNDSTGMRYRVSTTPWDISAWGSEQILAITTPISYSNPHYLSATGKTYLHTRSGTGGAGTNPMNVRATADFSTWDAQRTWITQTGQRPYVKAINNGVDRIDFFFTNCHPNEGSSSVYHCYMQLDAGVEKFYQSDGTYIGTGPVTPADATLIYDGSSVDSWVWDITRGADGHPRVLFARFPSTTDHRYMFSRWTGSAWTTPVEITTAGPYLYAAEANYSGGICFDAADPDTVYLSKQVGSVWELSEWATVDSGATWSKVRDIDNGVSSRNCRPFSPRNHNGELAVVWWRGTYTSYTSYSTSIWGAG